MFRKNKKLHGAALIEDVVSRFVSIVDELDKGVEDCQTERGNIRTQIESLNDQDASLAKSVKYAAGIATNLRTLLGA